MGARTSRFHNAIGLLFWTNGWVSLAQGMDLWGRPQIWRKAKNTFLLFSHTCKVQLVKDLIGSRETQTRIGWFSNARRYLSEMGRECRA